MRIVYILASALLAIPLTSAFVGAWPIGAVAFCVLVVTIRRPADGLLVTAGLLPLAWPISQLVHPSIDSRGVGELLLLPFLAAASARHVLGARRLPSRLDPGVTAAAAVVVAATVVGLAREQGTAASIVGRCWTHATTRYLVDRGTCPALHEGLIWMEGLLLAVLTELTLRRCPEVTNRTIRMLMIGAIAASIVTSEQLGEAFLRHQLSPSATLAAVRTTRIGVHLPDINAVGSLYALFLVPTFWFAWTRRCWSAWLGLLSLAVALWWTGSRAAVGSACGGVLIVAALGRAVGARSIVVAVGVSMAIVGCAVVRFASAPLSIADALRIRIELSTVGLAIASSHPAFGVGPGRMQDASRPLISDRLLALFPAAVDGENSHNNFVQWLAEFGVIGAGAVMSVVLLPILTLARSLCRQGTPGDASGLVGGLIAFLLTCLLGHPFLLPLCLWLFLLMTGMASAMTPIDQRSTRWAGRAATVCVALVVCSMPVRILEAQKSTAVDSPLPFDAILDQEMLDGVLYTTMTRHFALVVDPAAWAITVPLRLTSDSGSPCVVYVAINGKRADAVTPRLDSWLNARYILRPTARRVAGRIDLVLRETHCRVGVGQMVVE